MSIFSRIWHQIKTIANISDHIDTMAAERLIRSNIHFRGPNVWILAFSIIIASVGLNVNSIPVIIGAMLISPLMGPIFGVGLGLGIYDLTLLKDSLKNLLVMVLISLIASFLYFLITPLNLSNPTELLARTNPTIYDVLIALFGGFAGIFEQCRKDKGTVFSGVAIATALMPPLCTVGFGLATWQWNYFLGALYLFLINSIYIALATFIGIKLMKFSRHVVEPSPRARRVRKFVYIIAVLTLLPSVYLTYRMLGQERFEMNASRFVAEEFSFPSTQVLSHSATDVSGQRTISVTLIGKILPQDSVTLALSSRLRFYGLQGTRLNIVQGDSPDLSSITGRSSTEILEFAQQSIAQKQETIDSLEAVLAYRRMNDTVVARLAPELRVIFPQVADIAVTRAVFGNTATDRLDTVNVALVKYSKPLPAAKATELRKYLQARLQSDSLLLQTMK